MKSFLDFAKEKENDELKRQIDHHEEMADEHQEKAEAALMMGDRDGHALHMAKSNHFKTQCENLKSMKEEVEQIDELKKSTLSSYAKKAADDVSYHSFSAGNRSEKDPERLKDDKMAMKRQSGLNKAIDRLSKEEVERVEENHVAIAMGKELDDEGSMVMNQLDQIQRSISTMRDIVKDPEMQLPGWVQSKVTLAADYMETVAGYMSSKNEKVSEEVEQIDEMDKSQPSSDRGGESSGDPYAKGDKAKPVKTKNFTDKAGKILSQAMNKAYKKNVKEEVELDEATPAWQRKEGKSEAGGLNKKGIMSYRRANPGSKLSMAVTTKPSKLKPGSKAANRRKSFCARMSGMKKRLTSAKTAKDPNSRINKSLRKWNC
jgi:hypothetical protein